MIKIELELNDLTFAQARTQASIQQITVEKLFANILEQQVSSLPAHSGSMGLFADDPDMMDHVMEMVRVERETPLTEVTEIE